MWVAAQAGATRVVTLVQQLVLGWLLATSDFGLIGLAYTVSALVNLMANPGVDAVLVQRMRRFRHWATPAFWLGMTLGCVAALLMIAAAPLAAWAYGRQQLMGLILVLAVALPIQALQIVPKAQLQMQMRFRAIVMLGLLGTTLTAVLTIAFAYFGLEVYSFVIPVPIVAIVVSAATWHIAKPPIRLHAEFSRWKHLFGRSVTVGTTQLLNAFMNQADYMALGVAHVADSSIGAYVYAFNVAIQPLRLISSNVPVVLFPSLTHLSQDRPKQVRAALRAMRLLSMVTVPACMLQMLLIPALLELFQLLPKWTDAILPCQILTVGLMVNAACWPAVSLLLAQGRFREQMVATILGTLLFLILVGAAILWQPGIISVALAVMLFHIINSPFLHWVSLRSDAPLASFFIEFGPPLAAGLIGAVPSALLLTCLPQTWWGDVLALVAGGALFVVVYAIACWFLIPASVRDFGQQLLPFWHRLRGQRATALGATAVAAMDEAAVEMVDSERSSVEAGKLP